MNASEFRPEGNPAICNVFVFNFDLRILQETRILEIHS